jgi:hypothetical protein
MQRPPHHLSPSLPWLGWPHLCPACFVQPVSTVLSYHSFNLSSTVHARPLFLSLHPTKPNHVSPRHLCLQVLRLPKPCQPMPQVCAPSKPAFQCRTCRTWLAGGMPHRYCMVWTPSLHRIILTVLSFARCFRTPLPILQLPFFALDSPLDIFHLLLLS